MDEYIQELLTNEVVFEVTLPVLPKRRILESNEDLKPRISILEADLSFDEPEDELNEKKISRNEMEITSNDGDNDDDYANINLDKFERADEGSESSASEYISNQFDKYKKTRNHDKDYKDKDDDYDDNKYLSKKRHYRDEVLYRNDNKKGKEDTGGEKRKSDEPASEIKVDENSVEYWMSLRKKLGIN